MKPLSFYLTLLLAATPIVASAAPISPQQAIDNAISFSASAAKDVAGKISNSSASGDYKIAYTAKSADQNCFYVVNAPAGAGYTIVSADDRLPQILGYSFTGTFDSANIPPAMRWWLDEYRDQIDLFYRSGKAYTPGRALQGKAIEPLLKTTWNQNAPYNNLCPIDESTNKRSVTGCVATAMAQVMKHYNHPPKGIGTHDGFDFSNYTFDWDNMLPSYSGTYTEAQANAVATLMLNCGRSVDMNYTSSESGASSYKVGAALLDNFGYDNSLRYNLREYFSEAEWEQLIYEDLAKGHVVFYHGRTPTGGHAFVCDGFGGNGYFHFNWGWGGSQDGYFRLFALNPESGGIGSYDGGYNANQGCFTGVQPAGAQPSQRQQLIVMNGAIKFVKNTDAGNYTISFTKANGTDGMIINPLSYTQKITIFAVFYPEGKPEEKQIVSRTTPTDGLRANYGYKTFTFAPPASLADGTYIYEFMYGPSGQTEEMHLVPSPYGMPGKLYLKVEGGKKTLSILPPENNKADAEILINDVISPDGHFYTNGPSPIRAVFSNVGNIDFQSNVDITVTPVSRASEPLFSASSSLSIPAGYSSSVEIPMSIAAAPGKYLINFTSEGKALLGSPLTLDFEESQSEQIPADAEFEATNLTPAFYKIGDAINLDFDINPTEKFKQTTTGKIQIKLFRKGIVSPISWTLSASKTLTSKTLSVKSRLSSSSIKSPCDAEWQIFFNYGGTTYKPISRKFPIVFFTDAEMKDGENTLNLTEYGSSASLDASKWVSYKGDVVVPDTYNGKPVSLSPDAFTFASEVESITLGKNVAQIGNGAFYCASALKQLNVASEDPFPLSPIAFNPADIENIGINVPDGRANIFKRTPGWSELNFGSWDIETKGVEITDGLVIRDGISYNPYYVSYDESLQLTLKLADDRSSNDPIKVTTIVGDKTTSYYPVNNVVTIAPLHGEKGKLLIEVPLLNVETIFTDSCVASDVYTPTGLLILKGATSEEIQRLPKGIYIIGGKKFVKTSR